MTATDRATTEMTYNAWEHEGNQCPAAHAGYESNNVGPAYEFARRYDRTVEELFPEANIYTIDVDQAREAWLVALREVGEMLSDRHDRLPAGSKPVLRDQFITGHEIAMTLGWLEHYDGPVPESVPIEPTEQPTDQE